MSKADDALTYAQTELGKPYLFGAEGPNRFDCSGLVQYVMAHVGIHLPRTAAEQQDATSRTSSPVPGDLVFFGAPAHHVGIYLGNGKMIDAPHTGALVRIENVGNPTNYGRVAGLGAPAAAVIAGAGAAVQNVAQSLGVLNPADWLSGARLIALEGLAVVIGGALVVAGFYRLVQRPIRNAAQEAIAS